MLFPTSGIVLRAIRYSDTSIIAKIFTEKFGVQKYLVKGAKRKKSPLPASLFQPMAILNMRVYKKENKNFQTIREAQHEIFFVSIPVHPEKMAVVFFLSEILHKVLPENEPMPELFSFLHETMKILEHREKTFANLHLIFLMRLTKYLGFFPGGNFSRDNCIFDLREGKFRLSPPRPVGSASGITAHSDFLSPAETKNFFRLLGANYFNMETLSLSLSEKKQLLNILLRYYALHLPDTTRIRSHKILEEVFGNSSFQG